ncbi:LOW QUALITY PROTEIN: hypothetical protein CRUP_015622 [Coryphaenoides rupestris]|nr:LOW QUALITY PROTEIN: hypothetical protein CRUP_015622 [Coryphaenoides rupestris]
MVVTSGPRPSTPGPPSVSRRERAPLGGCSEDDAAAAAGLDHNRSFAAGEEEEEEEEGLWPSRSEPRRSSVLRTRLTVASLKGRLKCSMPALRKPPGAAAAAAGWQPTRPSKGSCSPGVWQDMSFWATRFSTRPLALEGLPLEVCWPCRAACSASGFPPGAEVLLVTALASLDEEEEEEEDEEEDDEEEEEEVLVVSRRPLERSSLLPRPGPFPDLELPFPLPSSWTLEGILSFRVILGGGWNRRLSTGKDSGTPAEKPNLALALGEPGSLQVFPEEDDNVNESPQGPRAPPTLSRSCRRCMNMRMRVWMLSSCGCSSRLPSSSLGGSSARLKLVFLFSFQYWKMKSMRGSATPRPRASSPGRISVWNSSSSSRSRCARSPTFSVSVGGGTGTAAAAAAARLGGPWWAEGGAAGLLLLPPPWSLGTAGGLGSAGGLGTAVLQADLNLTSSPSSRMVFISRLCSKAHVTWKGVVQFFTEHWEGRHTDTR